MSSDGYRVGVVGATGAVGSTILKVLEEHRFPISELVALASARSAGRKLPFAGGEVEVHELTEDAIQGLDIALSSAGGALSEVWSPKLVEAGAVVIDNTSFWRMHDQVPLVVPEVNPGAVESHRGIIANPNCSTIQMVVALAPIHAAAGIERLVVSTYQSISGTGQNAIDEVKRQAQDVLDGKPVTAEVYPHQVAFNVLPQVERFADGDDYTTEERKMMAETRKIMGLGDELGISATCVRVPVIVGHSESVNVQTHEALSPEDCRELLAHAAGVTVLDDPADGIYPMAIEAEGRDDVLVGRIRRDPSHERCLNLWVVGDNLRKGAATNAVQVAELLAERDLVRVPEPSLAA